MADSTPKGQKGRLTYMQLFLGVGKGGSLGETCGLALLLGGLLLIALNIVRWHIPVFYLGTVALITGIAWAAKPDSYASPLFHLLTGGVLLGAFFMATDMVTTPLSRAGAIYFAIGCGVLTHPPLGKLSGGRLLLNPHHECLHSAHRQDDGRTPLRHA